MEQVDVGIRDLANAVLLRAVQDAIGFRVKVVGTYTKEQRQRQINEMVENAREYIKHDEDFKYICSCVDKDYECIRKIIENQEGNK